jgi:hypothetical protein
MPDHVRMGSAACTIKPIRVLLTAISSAAKIATDTTSMNIL